MSAYRGKNRKKSCATTGKDIGAITPGLYRFAAQDWRSRAGRQTVGGHVDFTMGKTYKNPDQDQYGPLQRWTD
jgi:hypothetical protein